MYLSCTDAVSSPFRQLHPTSFADPQQNHLMDGASNFFFRLDAVTKCLWEQVQSRFIRWPMDARNFVLMGTVIVWDWTPSLTEYVHKQPLSNFIFWLLPAVDLCDGTSYCFRLDAVADKVPERAAAKDPGVLSQWCERPPDLVPPGQSQLTGRHGARCQTVDLLHAPGQAHVQCKSYSCWSYTPGTVIDDCLKKKKRWDTERLIYSYRNTFGAGM